MVLSLIMLIDLYTEFSVPRVTIFDNFILEGESHRKN